MELDLHGQINKRKGWQKVILLTIQGYFDNKVGRNADILPLVCHVSVFYFCHIPAGASAPAHIDIGWTDYPFSAGGCGGLSESCH